MITIRYDHDTGRVMMVSTIDAPKNGDLVVNSLPQEPPPDPPYSPVLYVRGGMPVWEMVQMDTAPCHNDPTSTAPEAPPAPTHAEIESARAAAYRQTVDPITCEIQRLRDMGGTAEEIAEAEARREKAVASIKEQYPYPEETNG